MVCNGLKWSEMARNDPNQTQTARHSQTWADRQDSCGAINTDIARVPTIPTKVGFSRNKNTDFQKF